MKTVTYPQYRKYPNEKAYFKVISEKEFEELLWGHGGWTRRIYKAGILPDYNYIYDLTFDYSKHWMEISREEYEEKRSLSKEA